MQAHNSEPESFHVFASDWLRARETELKPKTIEDYTWTLSYHLLPWFKDHRLSEITADEIDRYKAAKLAEGKIAPAQINKTLGRLSQILEVAVDYGHLPNNPAASRRRRVKAEPPRRTWVEPEQLVALLEAAPKGHRPILATMAGAGLRVGEACALDWRDLDLASRSLTVQQSKTASGRREVELPDALVNELWTLAATSAHTEPDDPVFVTAQGTRQTKANVSRRVKSAIKKANIRLAELEIAEINPRVSPHSLRRTFASLRYALGDDPIYVAEQGGWSDPAFPMRIYAKAVRRRERLSGTQREAFDAALVWAHIGAKAPSEGSADSPTGNVGMQETAL